jgi:hypothetical protein
MNHAVLNPVTSMIRSLRQPVTSTTPVIFTRPKIEAKVPTKPATKPGVRRVSVHYDFKKKILNVRDLKTRKDETRTSLLLQNVVFVVKEGERHGCAPTGSLGFAEGDESFDGVPEKFDGEVKWAGSYFAINGKPIRGASVLRIEGKTMHATGCIPL